MKDRHTGYMVCYACCLMILLQATAYISSAADWPGFRGPNRDGISSESDIPTVWSDTQNVAWKCKLPGAGFSSPIVVGKQIVVTCYKMEEGQLKRYLVSVDRELGKIVWSRVVPATGTVNRGPGFGTRHGHASHTPVSDGKNVYVLFGSSGVFAFDLQGNQLWSASVGSENAAMFGSAASPILYKDRLIVTAAAESESIRALDCMTGKEIWKTEAGDLSRSYCTPSLVTNLRGDDELLISVPFEVWSLNPDTGTLLWYAETKVDTNAVPSLVTQGEIAYVIGGRSGGRTAMRIGGQGDVTKSSVIWSTRGGSYVSSPVIYQGHLYWCNDRGIAYCVDITTGREVTRKRLGGEFYASIVLIEDRLYAVSRFGGTFVLKATPELKQIAHNRLSDTSDFSGSPAVSDGQLILRSDTYLYAIEAD